MTKKCIECNNDFEFKTHNQKYCSNQCCRIATNKRIMEKYYAKKDRLAGKIKRTCKCGALLSMYNSETTCITCQSDKRKEKTENAKEAIKNAINKSSKAKSR